MCLVRSTRPPLHNTRGIPWAPIATAHRTPMLAVHSRTLITAPLVSVSTMPVGGSLLSCGISLSVWPFGTSLVRRSLRISPVRPPILPTGVRLAVSCLPRHAILVTTFTNTRWLSIPLSAATGLVPTTPILVAPVLALTWWRMQQTLLVSVLFATLCTCPEFAPRCEVDHKLCCCLPIDYGLYPHIYM